MDAIDYTKPKNRAHGTIMAVYTMDHEVGPWLYKAVD